MGKIYSCDSLSAFVDYVLNGVRRKDDDFKISIEHGKPKRDKDGSPIYLILNIFLP